MPKQTIEYRCLLISPSDVSEERDALTDLVNKWNAQIGAGLYARVELVRWESHATPDMSDTPQNIINAQLVEDCDFGIAVFWSRLGTPTASHPSGSVEEIYKLIHKGARVLVYFCDRPVPQSALHDKQFGRLQEIRSGFQEQGLLATYTDVTSLREQVQLHLTNFMTQLLAKDRGASNYLPASGTMTAPTPDVRVLVRQAVASSPLLGTVYPITITVQNHSPVTVYFGNIFIEQANGNMLMFLRDFITGETMKRRELHSGDSFSLFIDPDQIREHLSEGLVCGAAKDEIGRIYRSNQVEFQSVIKRLEE